MPTYGFQCAVCGKTFDLTVSVAQYSKSRKPNCPHCGAAKTARTFTPVNVKTRSKTGHGWSG